MMTVTEAADPEHLATPLPEGPALPRRIRRLWELAYNLWWTWHPEAQGVFRNIHRDLWEEVYHNPIEFLRAIKRQQLNAVTHYKYYLDLYDRVMADFDRYMTAEDTWFNYNYPERRNAPIAYFSTEFGLHESLPIYAGGLGILSGDHLKEASDLGLPFMGVGFIYTLGYFTQHITEDGWQEAIYDRLQFENLAVLPVLAADTCGNRGLAAGGKPATIEMMLPGRQIEARIWKIQVGRTPLYLLDTNVESNSPADRELTARLYTSDLESRISQEMILGIGGVRALRMLGYNPAVWHMNEGHSAFMALERIRELVAAGRTFEQAEARVKSGTIFTTHTPVPAGNDEFPTWLIEKYFSHYWGWLGLERDSLINLARRQFPWGETFSMPVLAIRMSEQRNGVSELHAQIARKMWHFLWPERSQAAVPITHVTNGIHTGTWLARRMKILFNRYMGSDWERRLDDPEVWENVLTIPDMELWRVRRHLKRKLVAYIRDRARAQWTYDGIHPVQVIAAGVLLDPYALTIGFARRFATYKRAGLVLRDLERLLELTNRPNRPVQIIFAGKSHPADEPGKHLIQQVYRTVKRAENGGRLVFLEDYDMNLARYLVQGVDVWLNTPRRPLEASGTSGQKAALNGVLNFSVLDGWWREGFNGSNGWAIGDDRTYDREEEQDAADAESLYTTLENSLIPLYYEDRSADDLPVEWLGRMKESIRTLAPRFSTRRMVKEYAADMYLPAMKGNGL